jgi:hypothetical protein
MIFQKIGRHMEVPVPGQKDMNNCSSDHMNMIIDKMNNRRVANYVS